MSTEGLIERLKLALAESGKSPRKASLDAGMSPDAVRSILRNPTGSPTIETLTNIARATNVSAAWLAFDQGDRYDGIKAPFAQRMRLAMSAHGERYPVPPDEEDGEPPRLAITIRPDILLSDELMQTEATVPLVGYVSAGGGVHRLHGVNDQHLDQVSAPEGWTQATVAVEIRGDSLGDVFDRWLVYYDDVRRPVTDDLVNQLCVVGLVDDRVLIKTVRKSKAAGMYDLISEKEGPIVGVAIEWAARVKAMKPR